MIKVYGIMKAAEKVSDIHGIVQYTKFNHWIQKPITLKQLQYFF